MKSYKILGFIVGAHSCGACYMVDGKIIANIEEERLTRIKGHVDFENDFERYPVRSIQHLIERYGMDLSQIDYFTSFLPKQTGIEVFRAMYNFEIPQDKYIHIDHHEAHSILSYYMSGFQDDTLVFCADASGGVNFHSSKTYLGSNGKLKYIDGLNLNHRSLGHYYSCLTEFVGFKRLKDEGKIVGLSGHGKFWPELYKAWGDVLKIEGTKTNLDNHSIESGEVYLDMYKKYFEFVGSKYWKNKGAIEDIAHTGQVLFENRVVELVRNLHQKAPHTKKLALSGGIFANVKLNKRLNELELFDEIFVLPPMGDEGLALGCVVGVMSQIEPDFKPIKFNDMFLGTEYSREEILFCGKDFKKDPFYLNVVVNLLLDKKIVGLFQGRSESGPRALGNRSIICDCTHPETYQILNGRLQRNDYMPFAPAVLEEDADKIFHVDKSRYACEFMTILVDTRDEWKDKIPTVVHPIDKTARIQIVTESSNPLFHAILKKYKEITGIGILVNTSFNVHNEPIVEFPHEAFNHLRNRVVDFLVTPYAMFY
jgi:carbamoyltransferase